VSIDCHQILKPARKKEGVFCVISEGLCAGGVEGGGFVVKLGGLPWRDKKGKKG